jgi:hypothetical protein
MQTVSFRKILRGYLLLWSLVVPVVGHGGVEPVILVNRHVEVGIEPEHGLILGFGLPGGANLLWVNPHPLSSARHPGWINYGGEKLWWGPYRDWPAVLGRLFPPDEVFDRPWTVIASDERRLVMQSGVSERVGVRAEREITLASDRAEIVIRNRFTRVEPSSQPLQLWTVCQMPPPRWCWLDSRPATGEAPFVNLRPQFDPASDVICEASTGLIRATVPVDHPLMIGTRGGWIAAVYDELIVVHQVEPYPDGEYSDQVSLQLYTTPEYIELETVGGMANPGLGETMTNTVRWRLLERPSELTEIELGQWLRAQLMTRN